MAAPPTIPSLKQSFLAAQTTLLSQPLAPSRSWRASNDASSQEQPVPQRALDDALFALNHTLQQHCRRVYAPQATANIAEQISDAYTRAAERRVGGEGVDVDGGVGREVDLTHETAIESLAPKWPSQKDTTALPMESKRYADSVSHLASLSAQRTALKQRVERLRRIRATVEPLRSKNDSDEANAEPGVQENLLTRNGPVEKELEKMRFLLARVAGRVGELGTADAGSGGEKEVGLEKLGGSRKRGVEEFLADGKVFPR